MHEHGGGKIKAHVVAINMGYGHERAAHGLLDLAKDGKYWIANDYQGIPQSELRLWNTGRSFYEKISRMKNIPLIGEGLFKVLLDQSQEIEEFYPKRDLSAPSSQVDQTYFMIEKLGIGKNLIKLLSADPRPLICTFFTPAFAAEIYNYPGEIYLVICDADISRAWVSRNPSKSRIKYFAPNGRVVARLQSYGVPAKNIYLTGFPLPKSNVGGASMNIILPDLAERLCRLDPAGIFHDKYHRTLVQYFGPSICHQVTSDPMTITFAVGGAGAQKEIGASALISLARKIKQGKVQMNLVAGNRPEVAQYFEDVAVAAGLKKYLNKSVKVLLGTTRLDYFNKFDKVLHTTDVLWTKPSELSFFCGIGLPIIVAPPVGSQEIFNKRWLHQVGSGVSQNDPRYADEWISDWWESGGLARMAWNGFIEAPTHGAYRIEDIINNEKSELERLPMII